MDNIKIPLKDNNVYTLKCNKIIDVRKKSKNKKHIFYTIIKYIAYNLPKKYTPHFIHKHAFILINTETITNKKIKKLSKQILKYKKTYFYHRITGSFKLGYRIGTKQKNIIMTIQNHSKVISYKSYITNEMLIKTIKKNSLVPLKEKYAFLKKEDLFLIQNSNIELNVNRYDNVQQLNMYNEIEK